MRSLGWLALTGACASSSPSPVPTEPSAPTVELDAGRSTGEPVLDTSAWARAADSTFKAEVFKPSAASEACLVEVGCPRATPIPACPSAPPAETLERALAAPIPESGRRVVLRARLEDPSAITQAGCGWGCCNERNGGLVLTQSQIRLRLADRRIPSAFRCGGDDSITCCGFEVPEGEVIAAGRLRVEPLGAVLDEVVLCDPNPEPVPPVASFAAGSCTVQGVEHAAGAPFLHERRTCVCNAQRISCRRFGSCFKAGRWYLYGARIQRSDCGVCECEGMWRCPSAPCWNAGPQVYFAKGSAVVSAKGHENLDGLRGLDLHAGRLEIRGHATADEGGDAMRLSQRRAQAVFDALVRRGVPATRLFVSAHGTAGESGEQGMDRRRVDLVLWSSERTERPPR